jgi:hypothetical protein
MWGRYLPPHRYLPHIRVRILHINKCEPTKICKAFVWDSLTSISGLVGYLKWTSLKHTLPVICSGHFPSWEKMLMRETQSITENILAPAPLAMEKASIYSNDIFKLSEATMTPRNTCVKIIIVQMSS